MPNAAMPDAGSAPDLTVVPPKPQPYGCSDLFDESILPTYEIEINEPDWMAIYQEFKTRWQEEALGTDPETLYPIVFHYNGEIFPTARLRLKGSSSWANAAKKDDPGKMQFVIDFSAVDSKARFHGLRKVELDMPRYDTSFLYQRLAASAMREMGVGAECANNVRLVVNGNYYGLYTNLEHPDKEYALRLFPEAPQGDLWEDGYLRETNTSSTDMTRLNQFLMARDIASMTQIIDLDTAIREWASEVVVQDDDGYWGSNHNYLVYDHPMGKFIWLPHDLDATFTFRGDVTVDPVFWWVSRYDTDMGVPWHFDAVINDPVWLGKYVDAVDAALGVMDTAAFRQRILDWGAQIDDAAVNDPNKIFTANDFHQAISDLHDFVDQRSAFLHDWVTCMRTGMGKDVDGDQVVWCRDCNDMDPMINPSAMEICGNGIDENCNGMHDDACPPQP
jgi:hypothetical protein